MTISALRRQVKNILNNYTEAEIKVRNATSNDPQDPPPTLLLKIFSLTLQASTFAEVMAMVWKRLSDRGENWRHVYKALTLVDYLVKKGSGRVRSACCDRISTFQRLQDFEYVDSRGRDRGSIVRETARQLVHLLHDKEGNNVHSPSSFNASDLKQTQPQTRDEEMQQLQLAIALSMEESEKMAILVDIGPSSMAPPQLSDPQNSAQPKDDITSCSWDAIPVHCSVPVMGSPWTGSPWTVLPLSSSASNPKAPCVNSCTVPSTTHGTTRQMESSAFTPASFLRKRSVDTCTIHPVLLAIMQM